MLNVKNLFLHLVILFKFAFSGKKYFLYVEEIFFIGGGSTIY